jgi:hypothetical protein
MSRYIFYRGKRLVKTSWDIFGVFACMGGVWSTHIEMHLVCSLFYEGFGQNMLRNILCPRLHGMRLVNTSWYTFCDLFVMGRVWSTQVQINFLFSLAWNGFWSTQVEGFGETCLMFFVSSLAREVFGQHIFKCIYYVAGMGWVWSSQVEIPFGSSLTREVICQHMLRCILWPQRHCRVLSTHF